MFGGTPRHPQGPGFIQGSFGDVLGHALRTLGCFSPIGWEQKRFFRWLTFPPSSSAVFFVPPSTPAQLLPEGPNLLATHPRGTWTKRGHQCQAGHKCLSISELGHSWESPLSPLFGTAKVGGRGRSWPGTAEPLRFGAFSAPPASCSHQGPAPCDHMSFSTFPLGGMSHVRSPQHQQFPTCTPTSPYKQEVHCPKAQGCPPRATQQRDKTLFPH